MLIWLKLLEGLSGCGCFGHHVSHSLSHLTLTTSTRSLSPTSPVFPTFSSSLPEDLEPSWIELDRNLGTDPYQTQERTGKNYPNSISEDVDELRKVGVEMSHLQSQIHSHYDSAESTADSDLGDGELRKILASPLYLRRRGDSESFRKTTASGKPEGVIILKRGTSAQRTRADHSRRESLMPRSSQKPRASGRAAAMFFHQGATNRENQFESYILKFADPSNFGKISSWR